VFQLKLCAAISSASAKNSADAVLIWNASHVKNEGVPASLFRRGAQQAYAVQKRYALQAMSMNFEEMELSASDCKT
jgi:hypothetical protein